MSKSLPAQAFALRQESSYSPEKKRAKPRSRTSVSTHISCSGRSDLDFLDESDAEEDDLLPLPTQTTIVIKNLSLSCTRDQILELLDANGLCGTYDLVYVPVDFRSMQSHCYAFVNFVSEEVATTFQGCAEACHGFARSACVGAGGCQISWASGMQGLQAAIEKYRNSPVMHELVPDECKPLLFQNGKMAAFPPPTKKILKPRGLKR
jgi:hypothetical protein